MKQLLLIRWYRFYRNLWQILGVGTLFTVAVTLCWQMKWLGIEEAELKAYDKALKQFTDRGSKSEDVVIVAVDDETLQFIADDTHLGGLADKYGIWPYDRVLWADLIEHLNSEGARAVVFDLVMDTPGNGDSDAKLKAMIEKTRMPVYLGFPLRTKEHSKPTGLNIRNLMPAERVPPPPQAAPAIRPVDAGDEQIDAAFAIGGDEEAPVARATEQAAEAARKEAAEGLWRWTIERLAFPVRASNLPSMAHQYVTLRGTTERKMRSPLPPTPEILSALSGAGLVEPEPDPDGVLRITRFAYSDGVNSFVTLPVAAAADLLGAREVAIEDGVLRLGDRSLRINQDGTAKIDFRGKLEERFFHYSLIAVLLDKFGAPKPELDGAFRGKVVVVGGFAVATHDAKPTPFAALQPGCVKQAATLDSLLSGRFIVDAPLWLTMLVTFVVAFVSAAIGKIFRNLVVNVGWPIALYAGFFVVTGLVLYFAGVHLPATPPVWAGISASLTSMGFARLFADKKREKLKQSFVRYLDKTLVERMDVSNELPRLEGEKREITAFFSDIRGFSSFSEGLKNEPEKLVRVLNTYLTRVSDALVREGGCLDKYIGDAVVCLYGAPLRQTDHAVRACRGALAAQVEVAKLREEFRAQGLPDVYTRIGLNSGEMLVGNFGSEQLFDYTAMGDGMNLAARLEGANKVYETGIMIGEGTYALAKDHIEVRELDRIRVAGKKIPVVVYELLCLKGELPDHKRPIVRLYEEALALFRAAKFGEALEVLTRVDTLDPDDGPAQTLRKRCEHYLASPPPADFDGVANLEK